MLTREQHRYLQRAYRQHPMSEVADMFNDRFGTSFTKQQFYTYVKNHAIHSGRTGQFPKGNVPANKGTKGLHKGSCTSFKRGNVPANERELYAERYCNRNGYLLIKIPEPNPYTGAPTRFKAKHLWLWERNLGPVPKGHCVIFIDGDSLNCTLENLTLVSRAELAWLNRRKYREQPLEVRETLLALAKLECKRFGLERNGTSNATPT